MYMYSCLFTSTAATNMCAIQNLYMGVSGVSFYKSQVC